MKKFPHDRAYYLQTLRNLLKSNEKHGRFLESTEAEAVDFIIVNWEENNRMSQLYTASGSLPTADEDAIRAAVSIVCTNTSVLDVYGLPVPGDGDPVVKFFSRRAATSTLWLHNDSASCPSGWAKLNIDVTNDQTYDPQGGFTAVWDGTYWCVVGAVRAS